MAPTNDHEKAFWFRALQAFQTMVPDQDDQRRTIGLYIDEMGLTREVVDARFAPMRAKTMDPQADFEDILAVFARDLLLSRVETDATPQDAYDRTLAEVIEGLINAALKEHATNVAN
jgi:hypothetical protein